MSCIREFEQRQSEENKWSFTVSRISFRLLGGKKKLSFFEVCRAKALDLESWSINMWPRHTSLYWQIGLPDVLQTKCTVDSCESEPVGTMFLFLNMGKLIKSKQRLACCNHYPSIFTNTGDQKPLMCSSGFQAATCQSRMPEHPSSMQTLEEKDILLSCSSWLRLSKDYLIMTIFSTTQCTQRVSNLQMHS